MNLSSSEAAFYSLNRDYRGLAANSQLSRQLIRFSQESCFRTQKRKILEEVLKKGMFLKKGLRGSSTGRDETIGEMSSVSHAISKAQVSEEEKKRREDVLRQIEADNLADIENAFFHKGSNRVNIQCNDKAPSQVLRNMKHNFHTPAFWFLKGYDHYQNKTSEIESAIDSYRQSIRLNPSYVDAMHNLGCSYDIQQRYKMGMQWFERVIDLEPTFLDAYHGYALSAFKSGQPELGVPKLDNAIE